MLAPIAAAEAINPTPPTTLPDDAQPSDPNDAIAPPTASPN